MVRTAEDTCQLSMSNERCIAWLETGRWAAKDGRSIGPENLPIGGHGTECPCCASFAEEEL